MHNFHYASYAFICSWQSGTMRIVLAHHIKSCQFSLPEIQPQCSLLQFRLVPCLGIRGHGPPSPSLASTITRMKHGIVSKTTPVTRATNPILEAILTLSPHQAKERQELVSFELL